MFMTANKQQEGNGEIKLHWHNGILHNTALKDDVALYMKRLGEDYYILLKEKIIKQL